MRINPEHEKYAEKMVKIGDIIIDITSQFPKMEGCTTVEEVKIKYDTYLKKTSEFKETKLTLMLNLYPNACPVIIRKEHNEFVEELQKFIDGTDSMSKALDISNCFLDTDNLIKGIIFDGDMLEKGAEVQQKASETIVKLMEKICKKFGV